MNIITLDFETYYDADYSLSKLTYAEYINDSRFEVIGVGIKVNDSPTKAFFHDDESIRMALAACQLDKSLVICHNAHFDGAILETHYGIKPKQYFCTMMAARALYRPFTNRGSVALSRLAEHLGIGTKGAEVILAKGMHRQSFTSLELRQYADYCKNDVDLTYKLYELMKDKLPQDEHDLIDLTIKKYTRPQLVLDKAVLEERLAIHLLEKDALLERSGITDPGQLRSNDKFAELLKSLGVVPPTKVSLRTGKTAYAFAKTDKGLKDLLQHHNPQVVALVEARLGHKTSIEQSRIQRFLYLANLPKALLPVALLYYGAHTGRYSGTQKINLQNLTRGSALRKAVQAILGYKVVAGDLSQIEARIVAVLAGQWDLVQAFANGEDVYCLFASKLYGRTIVKNVDDAERFVGKTCILGLGYGMGAEKFYNTVEINPMVNITEVEAERTVNLYRTTYPKIKQLWRLMDQALHHMAAGTRIDIGPVYTEFEAIVLPNGMRINYPGLTKTMDGWVYKSPRGDKKIYGGALTENVVQALARIVLGYAELRLARRGLFAALQVHDELVYAVKDENVKPVSRAIELALNAIVPWMPNLPIASEVKSGQCYADAK